MKKLMAILILALLASCALPAPRSPAPGEVLTDGVWGGWQIQAGGMLFRTPVGIKTIGYPVQVVLHEGQWYIWENGYGMKIKLADSQ